MSSPPAVPAGTDGVDLGSRQGHARMVDLWFASSAYLESFDFSTEPIAFSPQLLHRVVLGLEDAVKRGHFFLDGVDAFTETLVLPRQKQHLPSRPRHAKQSVGRTQWDSLPGLRVFGSLKVC